MSKGTMKFSQSLMDRYIIAIGEKGGAITSKSGQVTPILCQMTGVVGSQATRVSAAMEELGLVKRDVNKARKRTYSIWLTDKGAARWVELQEAKERGDAPPEPPAGAAAPSVPNEPGEWLQCSEQEYDEPGARVKMIDGIFHRWVAAEGGRRDEASEGVAHVHADKTHTHVNGHIQHRHLVPPDVKELPIEPMTDTEWQQWEENVVAVEVRDEEWNGPTGLATPSEVELLSGKRVQVNFRVPSELREAFRQAAMKHGQTLEEEYNAALVAGMSEYPQEMTDAALQMRDREGGPTAAQIVEGFFGELRRLWEQEQELRDGLEQWQKNYEEANERVEQLAGEANDAEEDRDKFKREVERLGAELNKINQRWGDKEKQITDLREALDARDRQIRSLKAKIGNETFVGTEVTSAIDRLFGNKGRGR